MSFQTQGTHATSPDLAPVEVGVSAKSHAELVEKVEDLRETLSQTQNALGDTRSRLASLEGDRARLRMMESRQTRVEAQLDLFIRMQHPKATSMYAAQAPSSQHGTGPARYVFARQVERMC
uniref:Uncharacterized protein n=1 Tax=Peronospora matthiolae TaxID=2874970 RepID=A0AAV1UHK2_9STRA